MVTKRESPTGAMYFTLPESGIPAQYVSPRTKRQLQEWLKMLFGLVVPDTSVCPGHCSPLDAAVASYFATAPVVVWKASRGFGGKTSLLAAISVLELMDGADVSLLGGSGRQSQQILNNVRQAWNRGGNIQGEETQSPLSTLIPDEPSSYRARTINGNELVALTASTKSARGPHPQRLRMDEVDEMREEVYAAAMGQAMDGNGISNQTTLSSTHQYPDGTMTSVLKEAAERDWPVHEWCVDRDTMIAMPGGPRPIHQVEAGEIVYGYRDNRIIETQVSEAWAVGVRQTTIIETHLGNLTCTAEHKVLTDAGWKLAGDLIAGDFIISADVPGVWRANSQTRPKQDRQVLGVPQGNSQPPRASRAVYGMRRAEATQKQALPGMLQVKSGRQQPNESRTAGASAREAQSTKPARSFGGGITYGPWIDSDNSQGNGPVRTGLLSTGASGGDRSQRGVLAQPPRASEERPGEGQTGRGRRMEDDSAVDGSAPSVVLACVQRVRPGPTVEVWDMTVPDGHAFVANGLVVHNCWRESSVSNNGWLSTKQVEDKKASVPGTMWQIEYDLQEPNPEGRLFTAESLLSLFNGKIGTVEDRLRSYYEFEKPKEGALYSTGADWARDLHFCVITTLRYDVSPARLVAYERRQHEPYPLLVDRFEKRLERYPGKGIHDAIGVGASLSDYIAVDDVIDYNTKSRETLFSPYVLAVEAGKIQAPVVNVLHTEHKYCRYMDIFGKGHPPDGMVAMALAWLACTGKAEEIQNKGKPKRGRIGKAWSL